MTPRADLEARASRELRVLVDEAGAQGVPLGKAMLMAAVKLIADWMETADAREAEIERLKERIYEAAKEAK